MDFSYSIREATKLDISILTDLEKMCFKDPWTEEMFLSEFSNPLVKYYVAELDTKAGERIKYSIISYIGFLVVGDECQINNVAVHPMYRRLGVGSEILELVINETEEEGVNIWTLEVREGNEPAINLYQRFGFRPVGERPNYYEDGESALLLTREIDTE